MKRPKQTDKECRRQGMHDVPVANYSKMQDKYIDYLEKKLKNNVVLDDVMVCDNCKPLDRRTHFLGMNCPKCNRPFRSVRS